MPSSNCIKEQLFGWSDRLPKFQTILKSKVNPVDNVHGAKKTEKGMTKVRYAKIFMKIFNFKFEMGFEPAPLKFKSVTLPTRP